MSEGLKPCPCPLCGEEAFVCTDQVGYAVRCNSCELILGYDEDWGRQFDTEKNAIEAWNRIMDEED